MRPPRILWLATADARGHLMRAQILTRKLRAHGAEVDVVTTSNEGAAFLDAFGVRADVISPHYRVEFDAAQNMVRTRTELRVLRYLLDPARLRRDVAWISERAADADLVINDSFHPALLAAPVLLRKNPPRVVHVYGANLRRALEENFHQRLPRILAQSYAGGMRLLIEQAFACIEHSFSWAHAASTRHRRVLPPVMAAPGRSRARVRADLGLDGKTPLAAVYLNPHFTDPSVARAIEETLASRGVHMHAVGEGYSARPGWTPHDPHFVDVVGAADLLISAPGMGALTQARVLGVPLLAVVTDQPEQVANLAFLQDATHPVTTVRCGGDHASFLRALGAAADRLLHSPRGRANHSTIQQTHSLWTDALFDLAAPTHQSTSSQRRAS